jgi:hypothetical protein
MATITGSMGGDIATVCQVTTGTMVALGVQDPVHSKTESAGHFTPIEARLIAAALVDAADEIDNVDDGTPLPPSVVDRLHRVRLLHTRSATVHIDDIHRGLTPVYGDGCIECRTAWPCDTIAALDA